MKKKTLTISFEFKKSINTLAYKDRLEDALREGIMSYSFNPVKDIEFVWKNLECENKGE